MSRVKRFIRGFSFVIAILSFTAVLVLGLAYGAKAIVDSYAPTGIDPQLIFVTLMAIGIAVVIGVLDASF